MTIIRCRDCAAWDVTPEQRFYEDERPSGASCRRFAPRPIQYGEHNGMINPSFASDAVSPKTQFDDGCCEGIQAFAPGGHTVTRTDDGMHRVELHNPPFNSVSAICPTVQAALREAQRLAKDYWRSHDDARA